MRGERDRLEEIQAAIAGSAKYRQVSADLIAALGQRELAKGQSLKESVKAVKNKLHQIYGAFQEGEPRYADWLEEIARAAGEAGAGEGQATEALRHACRRMMSSHASARERLAIVDTFYSAILANLPPIRSILDLACGLNPLAIPWMPLAPDVVYHCCDIDTGQIAFLNEFFALAKIRGQAEVRDLSVSPPTLRVDLALALKTLPTLEQIRKGAGAQLLQAVKARHLLVSFPARSLGGREKHMTQHYETQFTALAKQEGWAFQRFLFSTEIAFLVYLEEASTLHGGTDAVS